MARRTVDFSVPCSGGSNSLFSRINSLFAPKNSLFLSRREFACKCRKVRAEFSIESAAKSRNRGSPCRFRGTVPRARLHSCERVVQGFVSPVHSSPSISAGGYFDFPLGTGSVFGEPHLANFF